MLLNVNLSTVLDWLAAWGLGMTFLDLRRTEEGTPLTARSRWLFANLTALFFLRGFVWSFPAGWIDVLSYLPAVVLPATELVFVESLLGKAFPRWVRGLVFLACAAFAILNLAGWRLHVALVERAFMVFVLGCLVFFGAALWLRDRARLGLLQNRFIDALSLACCLAVPMVATDFTHLGVKVHLGAAGALLIPFTLARMAGRMDPPGVLLWEMAVMALRVALMAFCMQVMVQDFSRVFFARSAAMAGVFLLLLTTLVQQRILASRRRDDSFIRWIKRLQTTDTAEFVAALREFPLTRDHEVIRLDQLEGFDSAQIKSGLGGNTGLVSLEALEKSGAAEAARLLRARGMNQLFRVDGEQGIYLCFRNVDAGGELHQREKLELVERMAALMEARGQVARQEEILRQSQKMEALGRLAGGISHEFGNLLMVIRGYAGSMVKSLGMEGPLAEDSREILKAADRGSSVVHQLLAFSRQQKLKRERLDLGPVLTESRGMLKPLLPGNVSLEICVPTQPVEVIADRTQIEQVILNLVINARDAMPSGGEVTLTLEGNPGFALLRIRDSGAGMDEATRARIFDPFFTTKPKGKGTGLGLATVYGIVEQSGGKILVESRPGAGTLFEISFPLA